MTPALKRWLLRLLRVAVALGLVAGFAMLLRGIDLGVLGRTLARANLALIGLAASLSFLLMGWKAWRLRVLLVPVSEIGLARLFRYTVLSYAASTLLPARAGEVLRVWLLARRDGVPAAVGAAVSATEKVFDALGMIAVIAPLPWLLPDLPPKVIDALWIVGAVAVAAVVAGWLLLRFGNPGSWLGRFLPGLEVLRRPREFAAAMALSLVGWLTDVVALWLVMHALGIDLPVGAALLTLLAVNIAITLPSTPGHVGTFELGALAALELCGVPREQAFAFALVYHAMQAIPLALIGLVELRFILRALAAPPVPAEASASTD